jgi:hypothetical protein
MDQALNVPTELVMSIQATWSVDENMVDGSLSAEVATAPAAGCGAAAPCGLGQVPGVPG